MPEEQETLKMYEYFDYDYYHKLYILLKIFS